MTRFAGRYTSPMANRSWFHQTALCHRREYADLNAYSTVCTMCLFFSSGTSCCLATYLCQLSGVGGGARAPRGETEKQRNKETAEGARKPNKHGAFQPKVGLAHPRDKGGKSRAFEIPQHAPICRAIPVAPRTFLALSERAHPGAHTKIAVPR